MSRDGADSSRQTGVHTTYITPYVCNFSPLSSLLPSAYHLKLDRWEEEDMDFQSSLQRNMTGVLGLTCTHYYLKYITNKDLLYSTGNSAQYSVITEMGKEFEKE